MLPNVWGQRGDPMAEIHYKSIPEVEWWRTRWKNQPSNNIVHISLHMTASTYNRLGYIRVQWPWTCMIQNMTCVVITMHNIDISECPWWRYTKNHDLHESWRYLTYTGIKSRELKFHEHWHDQEGSIYGMPPIWKVKKVAYTECHQSGRSSTQSTTSTCPTMWIEVSRLNIVVHRLITSHWCCYQLFCTIVGLPEEPPVDRLVQSLIPVYQLIRLLV